MPELLIKSRSELRQWVHQHLDLLKRPCVVLLQGNLGAGKTQVVRWFCEALGVTEAASPTFAIHHEYRLKDAMIDHLDLYRVSSDADLEASGFWDLLGNEQALMFVEWSERLPDDVWPKHWTKISIRLIKMDKEKSGEEESRHLSWEVKRP